IRPEGTRTAAVAPARSARQFFPFDDDRVVCIRAVAKPGCRRTENRDDRYATGRCDMHGSTIVTNHYLWQINQRHKGEQISLSDEIDPLTSGLFIDCIGDFSVTRASAKENATVSAFESSYEVGKAFNCPTLGRPHRPRTDNKKWVRRRKSILA